MKIKKFNATSVHGYLSIDINFFPDLTFITGVNGSGKTSALRLLMALLVPDIEEFASIQFSTAEVLVSNNDTEITISARRTSDELVIKISTSDLELRLTSSDLQLIVDASRRDESKSPIFEKITGNDVYKLIHSMSTPMFLGLDRRLLTPALLPTEEMSELRRREFYIRRYLSEDRPLKFGAAGVLAETNYLVSNRMQEIRAYQEKLDEDLRSKFFSRAFEYKPADITQATRSPSRADLDRYRALQVKIERAAETFRFPVPEIKVALTEFFERMTKIVESFELSRKSDGVKSTKQKKGQRKGGVSDKEIEIDSESKNIFEWIINKPQADRIFEHVSILEEYFNNRAILHESVNAFISKVNSDFLSQTKKRVDVSPRGELTVFRDGDKEARSISALSSGERQILVMLAHLSLNPSLEGSGVFIVDEPELSLHLGWQERFVDAVIETNPNVQLIFATHSPAIILDRLQSCYSLG